MTEQSDTAAKRSRLRWLTLGESIAIAALILSGLGLWHEWRKTGEKAVVVEQPASIPLALRGEVKNEGRKVEISPIEDEHALQSLTVTIAGKRIPVESDGDLDADAVAEALGNANRDDENPRSVPVRITARYIEAGTDKTATGSYVLTYRWKDKLFGAPTLRIVSLSR